MMTLVEGGVVDVWMTHLTNENASAFRASTATFTGDFVFTVTALTNAGLTPGRVLNFGISSPGAKDARELPGLDPRHLAVQGRRVAISFGSDDTFLFYQSSNGSSVLVGNLPYRNLSVLQAGQIAISPRTDKTLVTVWEFEPATPPLPTSQALFLHICEIYGDSWTIVDTLSLNRTLTQNLFLFEPLVVFDPLNGSRFYCNDGGSLIYTVGLDERGYQQIESKFEGLEQVSSYLRSMSISSSGKYLSAIGTQLFVLESKNGNLEVVHSVPANGFLMVTSCWSLWELYLVIGFVSDITIIIDWQTREIIFNETLEGAEYESTICSFSEAGGFFVMDSVLRVGTSPSPSQNLTTYWLPGFPQNRSIGNEMVYLPVPPTRPSNWETTSPGPSSGDRQGNSHACFPGSSHVLLANGTPKTMSSLSLGDVVLDSATSGSDVVIWGHRDLTRTFEFLQLSYEGQGSVGKLTVSSSHYIYLNRRLQQASTAKIGDCLEFENECLVVIGVTTVTRQGLFNPHTTSGELIVDGVRVSCYTAAVPPMLAHLLLLSLRLVARLTTVLSYGLLSELDVAKLVVRLGLDPSLFSFN